MWTLLKDIIKTHASTHYKGFIDKIKKIKDLKAKIKR
jgi:hypothetical protein